MRPIISTGLSGRSGEEEARRLRVMEFCGNLLLKAFLGATIGGIVGQDYLTPLGLVLVRFLVFYLFVSLGHVFLAVWFRVGL